MPERLNIELSPLAKRLYDELEKIILPTYNSSNTIKLLNKLVAELINPSGVESYAKIRDRVFSDFGSADSVPQNPRSKPPSKTRKRT